MKKNLTSTKKKKYTAEEDALLIAESGATLPEGAKITPMLRQWLAAKAKAKDAILLFRMGDFYELFASDATLAAPYLDLSVTSRDKGKNKSNALPMAGFPHHSASQYIAKLIAAGFKVSVCDQLEDPALAKGIVKRGVTRIITPGMVLEESALEGESANFLIAIGHQDGVFGLAALDISTGEFICSPFSELSTLANEIKRLSPREIIYNTKWQNEDFIRSLEQYSAHMDSRIRTEKIQLEKSEEKIIEQHFNEGWDALLNEKSYTATKQASYLCLSYLLKNQSRIPAHIHSPRPYSLEQHLLLDPITIEHLNLIGERGQRRKVGTLAHIFRDSITAMGARKLLSTLKSPLIDLQEIAMRHQQVEFLITYPFINDLIKESFQKISDLERLNARLASGRHHPQDVDRLFKSLLSAQFLIQELSRHGAFFKEDEAAIFTSLFDKLSRCCDKLGPVSKLLITALHDEIPASLGTATPFFKLGYSSELDEYAALKKGGSDALLELENRERERLNIPTIKIKYTRVFGYYIEISRKYLAKVPDDYTRKQTVAIGERFTFPELTTLEEKLTHAEFRYKHKEAELYQELTAKIQCFAQDIIALAEQISSIELIYMFSRLSEKNNFTRPKMLPANDNICSLVEARHPVLEYTLRDNDEHYVPANIELNAKDRQLLLITGPNMGGKSTLMRKVALIQILAQAGCFVPATSATLSICDRIFSRVGASDRIHEGQSTFMVEMTETAHILKHATPYSLVLLDEIGRGTATFDGLSLAWAVAEYMHDTIKAKTLFATHFHELCELSQQKKRLKNIHVVIKEEQDEVIFTRQIAEGGATRSYGIQVAKLAGLPDSLLKKATEILLQLEEKRHIHELLEEESKNNTELQQKELTFTLKNPESCKSPEDVLRSQNTQNIINKIENININEMTPFEAMGALNELVRMQKSLR